MKLFGIEIKKAVEVDEVGRTGLIEYNGNIGEELIPELKERSKRIKTYKEMSENDAVISGILFVVQMLCRSVAWKVEAYSKDTQDIKNAEFLLQCWEDMSHTPQDFISEALKMLDYGFSIFEIVYKKRDDSNSNYPDGKIGWRKFATRSQDSVDTWKFDNEGGIAGFNQWVQGSTSSVFIPIEKLLLFRTSSYKNNPEGVSVLRKCYRSWYLKKHIEDVEAIGIERDLAGLPVMYVPAAITMASATAEEKATYAKCEKIVQNVRQDEEAGIVLPSITDEKGNRLFDFKLITSGGGRSFDTDKIVRRYEQRIAMSMCADFMMLGTDQSGSFALSENKTTLFSQAIEVYLDIIRDVLNQYAIPRLFEINGMDTRACPRFDHESIKRDDIEKVARYVQMLSQSGMPIFPNKNIENYLLDLINVKNEDIE